MKKVHAHFLCLISGPTTSKQTHKSTTPRRSLPTKQRCTPAHKITRTPLQRPPLPHPLPLPQLQLRVPPPPPPPASSPPSPTAPRTAPSLSTPPSASRTRPSTLQSDSRNATPLRRNPVAAAAAPPRRPRNGSGPLSPTARRTVTFRWDRGRRARRMGRGTFRRRSIARRVFDADDLVGVVELCGLSSRRLSLPLSYPVVGAGGFFSSSSSSLTGLGEELALSPAAPACVLSSLIHLPRHVEAGTSSYALALLWIFLAADACLFPSPGFVTEDCTVPATYVSNR